MEPRYAMQTRSVKASACRESLPAPLQVEAILLHCKSPNLDTLNDALAPFSRQLFFDQGDVLQQACNWAIQVCLARAAKGLNERESLGRAVVIGRGGQALPKEGLGCTAVLNWLFE